MFNKTASASKKKLKMSETPTKSHTASIHLKTQQDQYGEVYRLPLKELIMQKKEEEMMQASHKKLRQQLKLEGLAVLATTRVHKKSQSRSAKKISVNDSRGLLGTDRSMKEFYAGAPNSKRLRTEVDLGAEESQLQSDTSYLKLAHDYAEENKKLKQDLKRKKDHVEIRADELAALLSELSTLKTRNRQLQQQLQFYKEQVSSDEPPFHNSVFKVLQL